MIDFKAGRFVAAFIFKLALKAIRLLEIRKQIISYFIELPALSLRLSRIKELID